MSAFSVVRFKVKSDMDNAFLEAHRGVIAWPGLNRAHMIRTGERRYCLIAEWDSPDALTVARPYMIATLDTFRHTLEDLGDGMGVTDPVSGPVVLSLE